MASPIFAPSPSALPRGRPEAEGRFCSENLTVIIDLGSSLAIPERAEATQKLKKTPRIPCIPPFSSIGVRQHEEPTTAVIQRYLDALPDDLAADTIVRELLDRAVGRLRLLCASHLHGSYPRLARPPVIQDTDELLGGGRPG